MHLIPHFYEPESRRYLEDNCHFCVTAGRYIQHFILVLISVTLGKPNTLYREAKEVGDSVTKKKARGPLTNLWA